MRTYTITEAAELTGLSRKAIARRVERGSLRSVVRNGRRRIPRSELVRSGLLDEGDQRPREGDPAAPFLPRPASGGALAETGTTEDMLATLFREVLDRFERQSQEIAQYRALTVQAESLRLTNELADLRVRLAELERQPPQPEAASQEAAAARGAAAGGRKRPRPACQRADEAGRGALEPRDLASASGGHACGAPYGDADAAGSAAGRRAASTSSPAGAAAHVRLSRTKRFALEAAFIVAVAVIVWQAELPTPAIAVAMALAWTLVAIVEWVSSERPPRT